MGERKALSELCRLLPGLLAHWSGHRLDLLEEGVEELRAGTVSAVEVCARIGLPLRPFIPGDAPPAPDVYGPLPGLEAPRIPAGTYVCPRRQCSRSEGRDADGRVPACVLFEEPLRLRTGITRIFGSGG
ncbi:hypothetical protein [Streptomyces roseoverticillatus]|uniref:Uncharacterized protein n=1 Tax=Streptomyces roseoverticillatus TaxID=66429 RepID=A0ABV3J1Z8_9ACTN